MKKWLLLFLLIPVLCFAQETWQYKKVVETWQDIAGKYRVKVVITNGKEKRCIILKFQNKETEEEVIAETNKICEMLNNPPPPEPTINKLKEIIKEKNLIIEELTKQSMIE
ncbi:MAG: hypothetical protein DRP74_02635 [Candidatus Omnitrophota bacterium]|nr:MAG: hypothetical protein DRP74_02635 [Candidatus Omnitrophota bacterium]